MDCITAGVSRVASDPLHVHAIAITPAGMTEPDRSCCPVIVGLPRNTGGSAPALPVTRPAQRSLTLRPVRLPSRQSDPLHRRLRRLRCLCRRFDCYRVERTSSRAGLPPAVDQRLFTAHCIIQVEGHDRCAQTPPQVLLFPHGCDEDDHENVQIEDAPKDGAQMKRMGSSSIQSTTESTNVKGWSCLKGYGHDTSTATGRIRSQSGDLACPTFRFWNLGDHRITRSRY